MMDDQAMREQDVAALRQRLARARRRIDELEELAAQRKRTEETLRRELDEQALLLDTMDAQVWYLTDTETYGTVNRAHAQFLGLRREDIEHRKLDEFLPKEVAQVCRRGNRRVFRTGEPLRTEEWIPNGEGVERLIAITKTPKLDQDGNVAYTVCVGTDITERESARKLLRESEAKFRTLVNQAPQALFLHEMEGRIVDVNQTAVEQYGYSREQLLQMGAGDIDPGYVKREDDGAFWRRLEEQEQLRFEARHRRSDGTTFPVTVSLSAIELEGTRHVLALAEDITEQKRAEAEIKQQSRALARANSELERRTTQLEWLSLIQSALSLAGDEDEILTAITLGIDMDHLPSQVSLHYVETGEDGEPTALRPAAVWQDGIVISDHPELGRRYEIADLSTSSLWLQGASKSLLLEDVQDDPRADEAVQKHARRHGFQALALLPLRSAGRWVGLVEFRWSEPHAFSNEERFYLQRTLESVEAVVARRRAYLARQRSEARYRTVFETTGTATVIIEEDTTISLANAEVESLCGYPPEEIEGKRSWLDFVVPRDRERMAAYHRRRREDPDHAPRRYECRLVDRKGNVRDVLFTTNLIPGTTKSVASLLDITERKRAQEALVSSKEMLETILRNMPGGTLLIGEDYRIHQVNARTCDITGYSEDELVGEFCHIVCPESSASMECPVWEEGGDGFSGMDTAVKCKDGRQNPVLKNAHKVTIRGETYILENFQDIARRKEMEEELRQQERLAAVGQLASGIAHDFRNLLATIILYAQMDLAASDLPPQLKDHLRIIVEESNKATDLVQQILDFSSRAMIEREPLSLSSFVRQTVEVLRHTIPENVHISLHVEPGEEGRGLTVLADAGRLQQALTNLALNARDAMPDGGHLRLTLSRVKVAADEAPPVAEMGPGAWVCLTISDTGQGMTEEVQDHLFEPFFTTKDVDEGTGLGLAQVYGIVRQHEGAIEVETGPGEGATFRIYLPAHHDEFEEASDAEVLTATNPHGQGETILLVEDNQALREAAQDMLQSLGYQVLPAADGREALALCASPRWSAACSSIDAVVTDLVMPHVGGKALMCELTGRGDQPDLKAVGITGYAVEDIADDLRGVGFVDLVHKPFDAERLAHAVRRALEEGRDDGAA